jgi:hypothetical protein
MAKKGGERAKIMNTCDGLSLAKMFQEKYG